MRPVGVVFVHGFLSSSGAWSRFVRLLGEDSELSEFALHRFGYRSPAMSLHPLRRIPDINNVADSLRTYLSRDLGDYPRVALVSHSQGGLVVQRLLARTLADGAAQELARIRLGVLFACPNAGSDLALSLRRRAWFWRHPQQRELRPLHELVVETQRTVLNQIVHGDRPALRLVAYAGESDAVVTPGSARSLFPEAGVLPGDHFSIIRPDSRAHRSYTALKHDLLAHVLAAPDEPANRPPPSAPARIEGLVVDQAAGNGLIDRLLEVPGMMDRSVRERVYGHLPMRVREQLPYHEKPRVELLGVVATLNEFRHLAAWDAIVTGVRSVAPDHPATAALIVTLADLGLIKRP